MDKEELVIAVTGVGVLLIGLFKLLIGYAYNVPALIADGYHGIADSIVDLGALVIVRAAKSGTFSSARLKYFFSFLISEMLILLGIFLAFEKVDVQPVRSAIPLFTSILAAIGIYALSAWRDYEAKRTKSPVLKAEAFHGYSDVVSTFGAFLGSLYVYIGMHLNVIGTLLVVGVMIFMGLHIAKESIEVLVEYVPKELREAIEKNLPPGARLVGIHVEDEGGEKVYYAMIDGTIHPAEALEVEKKISEETGQNVQLIYMIRSGITAVAVDEEGRPSKFGEAYGFVLYDGKSKKFIENPYRNEEKHRGVKAMRMLMEHGVTQVYAKNFGEAVRTVFGGMVEMKTVSEDNRKERFKRCF